MKNTEAHLQPSELYKQRKRRTRTRSPSIDSLPEPSCPSGKLHEYPCGSSSASRAFKDNKGKAKQEPAPSMRDELVIQWTTTSSNLANQLLSIPSSSREFEMKLQDALNSENDDIRLESLLNEDLCLPRRWQNHDGWAHARADLNGHQLGRMESEDYEEYIRKRMWSQSNRKHYIYSKEQEERRRQERERDRAARQKFKAQAKLSAERDASKRLKQKLKARQRCRDSYFRRWELLNSLLNSDGLSKEASADQTTQLDNQVRQIIDFDEIPWPLYWSLEGCHDGKYPADVESLNLESIEEFLIGGIPDEPQHLPSKKKIIRSALLSYHPDRFDRLLRRVKDDNQAVQRAKEWGLRVSQLLNELNNQITN